MRGISLLVPLQKRETHSSGTHTGKHNAGAPCTVEWYENSSNEYGRSKEKTPCTKSTRTSPSYSRDRNDRKPLRRAMPSTRIVKRADGSIGGSRGESVITLSRDALRLSVSSAAEAWKIAEAPPTSPLEGGGLSADMSAAAPQALRSSNLLWPSRRAFASDAPMNLVPRFFAATTKHAESSTPHQRRLIPASVAAAGRPICE